MSFTKGPQTRIDWMTKHPTPIDLTIDSSATTAFTISGTNTTAFLMSATATTGLSITGTITTAISVAGTHTTGISITGASTTALSITNGIGSSKTAVAIATSAAPLVVTSGTIPFNMYTTTTDTTGTITSFYLKHTQTANTVANQTEVLVVELETNNTTGDWANCIVARLDYATTGDASGGMSAPICSELNYPGKACAGIGGANFVLDLEMNCPTNFTCSTNLSYPQGFMNVAIWGNATAIASWEDYGFLFRTDGFTAASGNIISANAQTIRVSVENSSGSRVTRYMVLSQAEDYIKLTASPLTVAIDIGTCTDGIIFTGTVTEKCIDFGQVTLNGDSCCNLWSYGDGDGAKEVTITDYWFTVRQNVASVANPSAEKLASLFFCKFATTTAHQANLDIQGIGMTIDVGKNVGYAHAIDCVVDVTASSTTTTGTILGVKATIDFSSGTTMTFPGSGSHGAAILAQITGTGTYSGASMAILELRKSGATTIEEAMRVESQTGATITSAIHLCGQGNITNAIEFEDQDGSNGAKVVQATMDGDVADALVKIDINGTAYYIPAFNAAGITGEW